MKAYHILEFKLSSKINIFEECKGVDDALISRDRTIIRFYKSREDHDSQKVFSDFIFLNKDNYEKQRDSQKAAIKEEWNTVEYKKRRFLEGLSLYEEHTSHLDLRIEDSEEIKSVRTSILLIKPESEGVDEKLSNALDTLKRILNTEDQAGFDQVTNNKFLEEDIECELKNFIYIEDEELEKIDSDFMSSDFSFLRPDNLETYKTVFYNSDELQKHGEDYENFLKDYKKFQKAKEKRIKVMFNSGKFNNTIEELENNSLEKSVSDKIINTIKGKTKVCSVCQEETSSKYCENINCDTIKIKGSVFSTTKGGVMNFLFRDYLSSLGIRNSLVDLKNSDKEMFLSLLANEYQEKLKYFFNKDKEVKLIMNSVNYTHPKRPEEVRQPRKKRASYDKVEELEGIEVNFWNVYRNGNTYYGIIQTHDEIKTKQLVKDAEEKSRENNLIWSDPERPGYYNNRVVYVESDKHGNIKNISEGFLNTESSTTTRLKKGVNEFSTIEKVVEVNVYPQIDNIIYVESDSTDYVDNEEYEKGNNLIKLLDISSLKESERALKSKNYKYDRQHYYSLSEGYFSIEISDNVYSYDGNKIDFLGNGNIDKISYYQLENSIKLNNYKKLSFTLFSWYARNILTPSKASKGFNEEVKRSFKLSASSFLSEIKQKNSLLDVIEVDRKPKVILKKSMDLTKPESIKRGERDFYAYKMESVTPFMLRELKDNPRISTIKFTLRNNQGNVTNGKLNAFNEDRNIFESNMSEFMPVELDITREILTTKALIKNGLKKLGKEENFTVSLEIKIKKGQSLYDISLLKAFFKEQGITIRNQEKESRTAISIKAADLISFLL